MCNLSQGIKEASFAAGEAAGEARGKIKTEISIVLTMYNNGLTVEQISSYINKDKDEVSAIINGKDISPV